MDAFGKIKGFLDPSAVFQAEISMYQSKKLEALQTDFKVICPERPRA
jgi:hypothetical protein